MLALAAYFATMMGCPTTPSSTSLCVGGALSLKFLSEACAR